LPLPRSSIVLTVDRLGAPHLGPYGNAWIGTPAIDELAAQSVLFETALADSPDPAAVFRSLLHGVHALHAGNQVGDAFSQRLRTAEVPSHLLTDDAALETIATAAEFTEIHRLRSREPTSAAGSWEKTLLAHFAVEAADLMEKLSPPFHLWLHSGSLDRAWDAPLEFRERLAAEEDPDPPQFVEPPSLTLDADTDPDEVLGITQAYAGQVALLDQCLGYLMESVIAAADRADALLLLTSPRGMPLGEHLVVGKAEEILHCEALHVPLLLRFPEGRGALTRDRRIVQPADVFATLAAWHGLTAEKAELWGRDLDPASGESPPPVAAAVGSRGSALRTPAWHYIQSDDREQLYVMPDDRFEFNEIADRCEPAVVELRNLLADFQTAARQNDRAGLPELKGLLLRGVE